VLMLLHLLVIVLVLIAALAAPSIFSPTQPAQYDPSALVATLLVVVAISFGYLQLPGGHALARSLYQPLRWLLSFSAACILLMTVLIAIYLPPHAVFCVFSIVIFALIAASAFAAMMIRLHSNGRWIKEWLKEDDNKSKESYGRYAALSYMAIVGISLYHDSEIAIRVSIGDRLTYGSLGRGRASPPRTRPASGRG
jgi:hypothetical protein